MLGDGEHHNDNATDAIGDFLGDRKNQMFHSNSPVRKRANTRASSAAIVLGGALIGQPTSVIAEVSYPWCTQGGTLRCYYMTREQCEQTVDYHGFCVANPAAPQNNASVQRSYPSPRHGRRPQ